MPIDFPNSPAVNDIYVYSGKSWIYDGTTWNLRGIAAGAGSITSTEIATGAVTAIKLGNDISLTPADGSITTAKIAAGAVTAAKLGNDISLTPANGSITQAKLAATLSGITICTSSTRPGSPFVGQFIFETDTNTMKVWLGAAWSAGTGHATQFTATYLIVGGAGGGGSDMGGGGGGGGYLTGTTTLAAGTYIITVGSGGAGAPAGISQARGSSGINSNAFGFTAFGGGGGASEYGLTGAPYEAAAGGSGGGGTGNSNSPGGQGTPGQGFAGASGGGNYYMGGGGGAGSVGGYKNPGASFVRANGGFGVANDILGPVYYWCGGGGGSGYTTYAGDGGWGGGGGGAPKVSGIGLGDNNGLNSAADGTAGALNSQTNVPGGAGGINTGGGGGGGSHYNYNNQGGNGGSGIVVVKYLTTDAQGFNNITGGTKTVSGLYTTHKFLTTGSLVVG